MIVKSFAAPYMKCWEEKAGSAPSFIESDGSFITLIFPGTIMIFSLARLTYLGRACQQQTLTLHIV